MVRKTQEEEEKIRQSEEKFLLVNSFVSLGHKGGKKRLRLQ